MDKKRKIYYFSGTHWDREWYRTFQGFRLNLVDALDELIDLLEEKPEYGVFHLDGQTIILDDYLEIKPEQKPRLEKLIRDKRILIGPWYTMPDEQLVSGEALIRNLALGHKKCGQLGAQAWKCGYICDIFGHIEQMPQILNGFGIDTAVLGRGTNQHSGDTFFMWQAGNDSACCVYKLPEFMGYGSFATEVAGERASGEELSADSDDFKFKAKAYIDREFDRNNLPVAVIWDAMDHEPAHPGLIEYLKTIKNMYPDATAESTDLLNMFERVPREALPLRRGELIETGRIKSPHHHVLRHVLSSRIRVKQANDRAECLMTALETLSVLYRGVTKDAERYLSVLWETLLQNHAHDSICGCARDRIHREMFYRFSQVESFYEAFCEYAERKAAGGFCKIQKDGGMFTVVNPIAYGTERFIEATLPFCKDFAKWHEPFGYEEKNAFRLYGEDGSEIPYATLSVCKGGNARVVKERVETVDYVTIGFSAKLRAAGGTDFTVVPSAEPVRFFGSLVKNGGRTLDNGNLAVTVNADGTIDFLDRASNRVYVDCIGFLEDSEIGDGWNSVRAAADQSYFGITVRSMCVIHDSPEYASIKVDCEMRVPARLDEGARTQTRSQTCTDMPIALQLSLSKNASALSVKVGVDNTARDHRLRIRLGSVSGDTYIAGQAYTFVTRNCGADASTYGWKEKDACEKSTSGIISKVGADGTGLTVLTKYGLRECSADADGKIHLTLLRGFSKTHTSNGEDGGQETGLLDYEFSIFPVCGGFDGIQTQREYDLFKCDFRAFVSNKPAALPSVLAADGIAVSAIKLADDESRDIILRCYNPTRGEASASVKVRGAKKAYTADMLEQKIAEVDLARLHFCANEIKTLRIETVKTEERLV